MKVSAMTEEEDEDEGKKQCVTQSCAIAAIQGWRGGEDGVRFISR